MNRLLGLELLRGVAALLVLLEHLRWTVRDICGPELTFASTLNRFEGYWGVDVFFVLSGYLIGLTLDKPATTARSFLLARLARVLPLYLFASVLCLATLPLRSSPLSAKMVVTTFTLMPVWGDAADPMTAHPFGWTLCYEMLFYVVATGLSAAVGCRRAVPLLIGAFALGPLAFTAVGPFAGWDYPSFALSPLTAEFALGLIAYRLTDRVPKRAAWLLVAAAVAGCVRGGFAPDNLGMQSRVIADPLLAWDRVARYGLPAFLGVLGVARLDRAATFAPVGRFAAAAGAVSYSLYLLQPFAFRVSAPVARLLGLTEVWPAAAFSAAAALAVAVVAARYIDRPLHTLAKGWAKRLSAPRQPSSARSFWTFASIRSRTAR